MNKIDGFDGQLFDHDCLRNSWRAFLDGDLQRSVDVEKLLQLGMLNEMLNGELPVPEERAVSTLTESVLPRSE